MTSAVLTWCNIISRRSYIITDLGGALDRKARHSYQFPGPPPQVPARLEGLEKATWQEVESDCTGDFSRAMLCTTKLGFWDDTQYD